MVFPQKYPSDCHVRHMRMTQIFTTGKCKMKIAYHTRSTEDPTSDPYNEKKNQKLRKKEKGKQFELENRKDDKRKITKTCLLLLV